MRKSKKEGFLLLEILVSALILAGAVASAMYLFRTGFQYLERIRENNLISSKVPQALTYLVKEADLSKGQESLSLGEGVTLSWKANLLEKIRPQIESWEGGFSTPYELYLYRVSFSLSSGKIEKTYEMYVTKYKMLISPGEFF
ncbi:MAG: type II secretion system protein [Caldimicrobium sp.]